jgi:hypothetical protein
VKIKEVITDNWSDYIIRGQLSPIPSWNSYSEVVMIPGNS